MATDALHSVESAARFLGGISVWTVRAWLSQGRIKRTKIGRRTMVRESELMRFIEEGEKRHSTDPSRVGRSNGGAD